MKTERSWLVEIKWWLSSLASLLAVLSVFGLIKAALSLATVNAADIALAGITDPYGDALGKATLWPVAAVFAFYPFMIAAALGFRLLVPTFAGAAPRRVAVVVMVWPVGLGAALVSQDLVFTGFITLVAIAWALVMPMPKKTVLTDNPIWGGAIIGVALGTFSPILGLEWAILWCVLRLLRGKTLEVAATAVCAAIMPALFMASQLIQGTRSTNAIYITAEVLMLAVLAFAGFVRWQFSAADDEDEDGEDSEERGSETATIDATEAART
jgi:hypothetical protein